MSLKKYLETNNICVVSHNPDMNVFLDKKNDELEKEFSDRFSLDNEIFARWTSFTESFPKEKDKPKNVMTVLGFVSPELLPFDEREKNEKFVDLLLLDKHGPRDIQFGCMRSIFASTFSIRLGFLCMTMASILDEFVSSRRENDDQKVTEVYVSPDAYITDDNDGVTIQITLPSYDLSFSTTLDLSCFRQVFNDDDIHNASIALFRNSMPQETMQAIVEASLSDDDVSSSVIHAPTSTAIH